MNHSSDILFPPCLCALRALCGLSAGPHQPSTPHVVESCRSIELIKLRHSGHRRRHNRPRDSAAARPGLPQAAHRRAREGAGGRRSPDGTQQRRNPRRDLLLPRLPEGQLLLYRRLHAPGLLRRARDTLRYVRQGDRRHRRRGDTTPRRAAPAGNGQRRGRDLQMVGQRAAAGAGAARCRGPGHLLAQHGDYRLLGCLTSIRSRPGIGRWRPDDRDRGGLHQPAATAASSSTRPPARYPQPASSTAPDCTPTASRA